MASDPAVLADLLDARRATAFAARALVQLSDAELDGPSLVAGWTRRHVVAHLGYNARALTRLVQWANAGMEIPMYASPKQRDREIEVGATLPPRALRHLFDHAAISLNVEWRDSPDAAWRSIVRTAQGREVPLAEVPWLRTRELWVHAIDLDNGARFSDLPRHVAARLLGDIASVWSSRGLDCGYLLTDASGERIASSTGLTSREVQGSPADLVAWATGRARASELARLTEVLDGGEPRVPAPAPRWI
nr:MULTISPECIES: maleylpyruvate isomerase family mycothiol-dependent enzyme [unclassified Leucobacter]